MIVMSKALHVGLESSVCLNLWVAFTETMHIFDILRVLARFGHKRIEKQYRCPVVLL